MTPAMTSAPLSNGSTIFRPAPGTTRAAGAAPAAPEYQAALRFQQRFWEQIWQSQRRRGYQHTTLTPEFGPDGYLHHLPFTNVPVADLWSLNAWMAQREQQHFVEFTSQTE
jgi:hypothetical protein